MADATHAADTQTPAQWAVRFFAVVSMATFVGSVPIVHAIWHGAMGRTEPACPTRHHEPMPSASTANVLDGTWMARAERSLQEDAPLTWHLRSAWNELRYTLGAPRGCDVLVGKDEWFFLAESVAPDLARWREGKASRMALLAEAKQLVESAGAQLVVSFVPDKERVHPEKLYDDAQLPGQKRGNFALALAEFAEARIPAIDLAAAMEKAQTTYRGVDLYRRRDTHWNSAGAFAAGVACAEFLETKFGDALGPRGQVVVRPADATPQLGDLVGLMGLGTLDLADHVDALDPLDDDVASRMRVVACSPLTHRLAEPMERHEVDFVTPTGRAPIDGNDRDATVWLLGTSFADANGAAALALQLGRPIRWTIRFGASGLGSLRAALPELRHKTRARVVVWEIVERGYFSEEWAAPAPLPRPTDGG
jgi:SGNH hydrolase-like domain, acetyltransferase AlgX